MTGQSSDSLAIIDVGTDPSSPSLVGSYIMPAPSVQQARTLRLVQVRAHHALQANFRRLRALLMQLHAYCAPLTRTRRKVLRHVQPALAHPQDQHSVLVMNAATINGRIGW